MKTFGSESEVSVRVRRNNEKIPQNTYQLAAQRIFLIEPINY